MSEFTNFLVYLIIVTLFMFGMILFSHWIKNTLIHRDISSEKIVPYESGVPARGEIWGRFGIRFWTIALLFLLFDVEVAYLYPWAYRLKELGRFGLLEGLVFIGILGVGYIYILREGGIKWL